MKTFSSGGVIPLDFVLRVTDLLLVMQVLRKKSSSHLFMNC